MELGSENEDECAMKQVKWNISVRTVRLVSQPIKKGPGGSLSLVRRSAPRRATTLKRQTSNQLCRSMRVVGSKFCLFESPTNKIGLNSLFDGKK